MRAAAIADPQFGRVFTDHMVSIRYKEGLGWHDAKVMPRGPLSLDPATAVLHYAQEIFEGLKAYRLDDGSMALFRVEANAARFNASARRMAMAELPEDMFIAAVKEAVAADAQWFPPVEGGALYLRPFMYASEVFLGVKPASEYHFLVIVSPVGLTHAWADVFIPGDGWVEFDPTNDLVADHQLLRIAVARVPEDASPIAGSFTGPPGSFLGLSVGVLIEPDEGATVQTG